MRCTAARRAGRGPAPGVHRLPAQASRRLGRAGRERMRRIKPPGRADARRVGCSEKAQAEGQLRSLELFGMRFGLDRMRRMMTALGSPERRLRVDPGARHQRQVLDHADDRRDPRATGCTPAPTPRRTWSDYRERVQVDEREIEPAGVHAAVAPPARAAERVNRTLGRGRPRDAVRTADRGGAVGMAEAGVEVAVVEAGLGGRYDATSVIDSRVTVLTNVGLEHTRWLGPTMRDIAEEKLAVPHEGDARARRGARSGRAGGGRRVAAERDARIVVRRAAAVRARAARARRASSAELRARARGRRGVPARAPGSSSTSGAVPPRPPTTVVPGRLQLLAGEPPTVLDGAHNPHAVAALVRVAAGAARRAPAGARARRARGQGRRRHARARCCRAAGAHGSRRRRARARSRPRRCVAARQLASSDVSSEPRPARALAAARRWAAQPAGAVLATGSVYLVGELLARAGAVRGATARRRGAPQGAGDWR